MRFYFRGRRVRSVSRYTGQKVVSRRRRMLRSDFFTRLKGPNRSTMLITTALASIGFAVGEMPAHAAGPVYDWSGFYIGANAGYGDIDNDGFFASSVDLSFGGGAFVAGGQVGWNFQRDGWLFGVEAHLFARLARPECQGRALHRRCELSFHLAWSSWLGQRQRAVLHYWWARLSECGSYHKLRRARRGPAW